MTISRVVGWAILLLLTVDLYAASTVRGKLYRAASGRSYGAQGIGVRLLGATGSTRTASTASDGFFYFYNVPTGAYTLEVLVGGRAQVYSIRVAEQAYTDIAPIQVP
jgi:hypothetical protein